MINKKKLNVVISLFFTAVFVVAFANSYYAIYYPIRYNDAICKYTATYNLDKTLVASLINVESHFNPKVVSYAGAMGLMQIMPSTAEYIAKLLKEDYLQENLYNPVVNIKYGCFYLRYLKNKFQSDEVVLSAYNAGETTVNTWLKNPNLSPDGKNLKSIPYRTTDNYVRKILNGKKYYLKRI